MHSTKADKLGSAATASMHADHLHDGVNRLLPEHVKILPSRQLAPGRGPYTRGRVAGGQLADKKIYRDAHFHSCVPNGMDSSRNLEPAAINDIVDKPDSLYVTAPTQVQVASLGEDGSMYSSVHSGGEHYYLPNKYVDVTVKSAGEAYDANTTTVAEEWSTDEKLAANIRKALVRGDVMDLE